MVLAKAPTKPLGDLIGLTKGCDARLDSSGCSLAVYRSKVQHDLGARFGTQTLTSIPFSAVPQILLIVRILILQSAVATDTVIWKGQRQARPSQTTRSSSQTGQNNTSDTSLDRDPEHNRCPSIRRYATAV